MVQRTIALRTNTEHYVTIVNGGGLGGPNSGPGAVALHTDAAVAGPWEQFQFVWVPGSDCVALKTEDGHYVTAVNGGDIGGPNDQTCPVHTDASVLQDWEKLVLDYDPNTQAGTLRTFDGHYLTAVNGGGFGGPNDVPIHTDATTVGPWETFSVEYVATPGAL
jgi:hypothetical protein